MCEVPTKGAKAVQHHTSAFEQTSARKQIAARVRAWSEAHIPDRLMVPCERVQQLTGGHIKDGNSAIHDAAGQSSAIRAERHAQNKLILLILLISLHHDSARHFAAHAGQICDSKRNASEVGIQTS